jgi:putative redox protein
VFAHFFTFSKNFNAIKDISRALKSVCFGVLQFDFKGLGDSDDDFANTNFSGNVDDLLAVINYFKKYYAAITLLVGHSLGGATAVCASAKANSIEAIATIVTPSDTKHIKYLFCDQLDAIVINREATVQVSGSLFKIKEKLLRDLNELMDTETLT